MSMKIIVKHVDILTSSLFKTAEETNKYLVYKMTEDNIPISCDECFGEVQKVRSIEKIQEKCDNGIILPIYVVTYEEYKNNVLRNEHSYV